MLTQSNISLDDLPARLTLKQSAAALGISYAAFLRWIKDGRSPRIFRNGRTRFVRRDELIAFVERCSK